LGLYGLGSDRAKDRCHTGRGGAAHLISGHSTSKVTSSINAGCGTTSLKQQMLDTEPIRCPEGSPKNIWQTAALYFSNGAV
jgi:hypothetical protein